MSESHRRIEAAIADAGGEIVDDVARSSSRSSAAHTTLSPPRLRSSANTFAKVFVSVRTFESASAFTQGSRCSPLPAHAGLDLHRAARICAAGHGRQILLSQSTRELVLDAEVRDLGRHSLKGIERPERNFQFLGARTHAVPPAARGSRKAPSFSRCRHCAADMNRISPRSLGKLALA